MTFLTFVIFAGQWKYLLVAIKVLLVINSPTLTYMLRNLSKRFYSSCAIETSLPDVHKMASTIMKQTFRKQEPKITHYVGTMQIFQTMHSGKTYCQQHHRMAMLWNLIISSFINASVKALNKHAPAKRRYVRVNQASFMGKDLKKAITHRTNFRNIFLRKSPQKTKELFF